MNLYEPLYVLMNPTCFYRALNDDDNDIDNDQVCDDDEIPGCTDPNACNFDPNLGCTDDDGTCFSLMLKLAIPKMI